MSKQLGRVEVLCEAPPYPIVRASCSLGIRTPEDVRWLRMSTFRCRQPDRTRGLTSYLRGLFRGMDGHVGRVCTCGSPLPNLWLVMISLVEFDIDQIPAYLLGQCVGCRTVFWDVP
jgi:hypothetical protein